jgi:hypothetical protein
MDPQQMMDVTKRMDELSHVSSLSLKRIVIDLERKLKRTSTCEIQIDNIKEMLKEEVVRQESSVGYDDHSATIELIIEKVNAITD